MTFGVVTAIDSLADIGERLVLQRVKAVEMGYSYFADNSEPKIAALGETYRRHGMRLWSVHAPFGGENNLSDLDESKRMRAVETQSRLLPRVAMAGAEVVIIHPGVGIRSEDRPAAADALRRSLPALTRTAEVAGVRIALENMLPGHLGDDGTTLMRFVEENDSPALGICFDTGHAHCLRKMRETFQILQPRIITFHLQDNDGTRDMHLQPGYGTLPWWEFVEVFRQMEFHDPLVVEARAWDGENLSTLLGEMRLLFERAADLKPMRLPRRLS